MDVWPSSCLRYLLCGSASLLLPQTIQEWQILSLLLLCAISLYVWYRELTEKNGPWFFSGQIKLEQVGSVGLIELFFCIALISAFSSFSAAATEKFNNGWQNVFAGLGTLVGSLAFYAYLSTQNQAIRDWLFTSPRQIGRSCLNGLIRFLLIFPWLLLLHGLISLGYKHPTLESLTQDHSLTNQVQAWFGAVIVAPIFEEFFFRGILIFAVVGMAPQQVLRKEGFSRMMLGNLYNLIVPKARPETVADPLSTDENPKGSVSQPGVIFALIISSVFFAVAHLGQGLAPVSLFLLGLFLGWLFLKTNSLWACISAHVCMNAFALCWQTLSISFK